MGGASLLERILDKVEDPTNLPLELLKDITNDFSEERKIGQGGFGEVYKGVLGERIVAVKRIHMNLYTFDDKLFHREVSSLMKTNHRNVVRFLGVCSHGYQKPIEEDASGKLVWADVLERLLCFEYISNGSLNKHITAILKNIIRDCQGREYNAVKLENLEVGQLIKELYNFLKDKRYFIVIDDVWSCGLWDAINDAFPRDKCGSRVIATTRIPEVVDREIWRVENKVYRIKQLGDEDSRSLFFRRMSSLTTRQKEISKDILKKCGGMPLAINSIASHLARHPLESSWEHAKSSLGAMKGNDIENMKQILELSYIHLPDHLKTCLLHVCMYPEDREIKKIDLLRQWVAEGFVSIEEGQDAEVVAEEYFEALIDMFMIQPGQIDYYSNEVLSCRVHDIILDLMRSKSSKEKFIHVIDGLKDVSGQIRRVSVESNGNKDSRIIETINKGSLEHVRSVLLYRASFVPYFLKYNYVRVLQIVEPAYSESILDLTGISRLFLLRYLKVERCGSYGCVLKLPNQIGQLQQLETIDLKGGELRNYPPDIVHLPCLSHLIRDGYGTDIVLPDEIGRMKSLRTLVGVCVSCSTVENIRGLGELINLRELHIQEQPIKQREATSIRMEALHSSICKLSASLKILYLRLYWDETYNIHYRYYWSSSIFPQVSNIRDLDLGCCSFRSCPPWIGQLQNLYKFAIVVREVGNAVSIVAELPCLAYFLIYTQSVATKEERVVISGSRGAFRALKELLFFCPKVSLTFEVGSLPKLEKLNILFRYHMARQFLPVDIQHLPSPTLKEISLGIDENDFCKRHPNHKSYDPKYYVHIRRFKIMLTRAFKPHHPAAEIVLYFLDDALEEVNHSEDHEGIEDEEDCCSEKDYQDSRSEEDYEVDYDDEDDYSSQEDDEGSYEVSGSQTLAQFHANTRQVELIEAPEDSGRMGTNIDVNQSPNELDYEEYLWIDDGFLESMRNNLTDEVGDPDTSSQLPYTNQPSYFELTQPRSELNQAPNELNVEEGEHFVDDEQADEVVYQENVSQNSAQVQAKVELIEVQEHFGMMSINTDVPEAMDDDPSPYAFWDSLVSDDEGPNDNETSHDVSWDNLLMDSDDEGKVAVGQA